MNVVRLNTRAPECELCGIPLLPAYRAERNGKWCAPCEMYEDLRRSLERAADRATRRGVSGAEN